MVAIRLGVDSYREGKVKFFDAGTQKQGERGAARASYEGDSKNPADSKYNKARPQDHEVAELAGLDRHRGADAFHKHSLIVGGPT